jgi:hypothetical protein
MTVGVLSVGVMTVGVLSVGVMTVGVLSVGVMTLSHLNKGNNKITELRTILQRESNIQIRICVDILFFYQCVM